MRSDTATAALRDIAHHIDLALSFTAGFDYEAFVSDLLQAVPPRDRMRLSGIGGAATPG